MSVVQLQLDQAGEVKILFTLKYSAISSRYESFIFFNYNQLQVPWK